VKLHLFAYGSKENQEAVYLNMLKEFSSYAKLVKAAGKFSASQHPIIHQANTKCFSFNEFLKVLDKGLSY